MIESPYLPVELIFNLLCVCRKIISKSPRVLRQGMYRRGLCFGDFEDLPRFTFWIRLCQSASLLDEGGPPRPTPFVEDWLGRSLAEQIVILLEAWVKVPDHNHHQRNRERLLEQLLEGGDISPSYRPQLVGLQSLGICWEDNLTDFGFQILSNEAQKDIQEPPQAWQIKEGKLQIPYPPDWKLLWNLELYLDPISTGLYLLSDENLRRAAQQEALGNSHALMSILEEGMGESPPFSLQEKFERQPILKIIPGPVLEMSSPEDLKRLRETPSMRKNLNHILSPHHVSLDFWQAPRILRGLKNRGLLNQNQIRQFTELTIPSDLEEQDLYFSTTDRAYILTLILSLSKLDVPLSPPAGLLRKLILSLEDNLRASAVRRATELAECFTPHTNWVPEEEPPEMPQEDMIDFLESAILKEEPIDVLYHVPSRSRPEHRHLTPLLLEQRGPRFYLIAYCHHRRANRTFRLDRMQLLDGPPLPGGANPPS